MSGCLFFSAENRVSGENRDVRKSRLLRDWTATVLDALYIICKIFAKASIVSITNNLPTIFDRYPRIVLSENFTLLIFARASKLNFVLSWKRLFAADSRKRHGFTRVDPSCLSHHCFRNSSNFYALVIFSCRVLCTQAKLSISTIRSMDFVTRDDFTHAGAIDHEDPGAHSCPVIVIACAR